MPETIQPLERCPEPLDVLKRRYPAALQYVYDAEAVVHKDAIRPAEVRANVFDWDDGLRMIVSRMRVLDGRVYLNLSASFQEDSQLGNDVRVLCMVKDAREVFAAFIRTIPARFRQLSGDNRELRYIGLSDGNVPHWCIEEE